MRTAEEIFKSIDKKLRVIDFDDVIKAINEARKEAIEECAEKITTKIVYVDTKPNCKSGNCRPSFKRPSVVIDKESILSLINELK